MKGRVKVFSVLVSAFVILAAGSLVRSRLSGDIAVLEETRLETRLALIAKENEKSAYQAELAIKDTDSYIMDKARSLYGYILPGELRFQVTNPESLYDDADVRVEVTP